MNGHRPVTAASRAVRVASSRPRADLRPNPSSFCVRRIQISSTPSTPIGEIDGELTASPVQSADSPDARFEILGAPYSVLSVTLSASQPLYTRRGTLIGVGGKTENATSTLSMLKPIRRSVLGIPFLYQKITSTSPLTALISTKSPITSFAVAHLDGTIDWMIAQRRALLAWTGYSLVVRPAINRKLSLAHWGNSQLTGRGLVALAGNGQIYQLVLKPGESYVAHPSNVVAYTITPNPPLPYRLKSSVLRMEIPSLSLSRLIPDTKFFRVMRESDTWKALHRFSFTLRTWSRRTIWGDRLFLQFHGPINILLQSRASRMSDVLTTRDVNEIAETEPGAVRSAVSNVQSKENARTAPEVPPRHGANSPIALSVASIGADGKVRFENADDFKSLKQ